MGDVVRLPNGRFPAGSSGNVRGMSSESRRQLWKAQKLAAQNAEDYIREVEAIIRDPKTPAAVRVTGYFGLLDRAGLRPGTEWSPDGSSLHDLNDNELAELVRLARERAALEEGA